jgi:hypothetical protein
VTDGSAPAADLRTARVLAVLVGVVLLAAVAVGSVQVIRERGARAGANSRLDFADREIAWGNGWMLSQTALYAARSLIPREADYTVEKGDESVFDDPLTYRFAEGYLRYWLMPRRQQGGAAWVVCMRCERDALGPDARVVWEDGEAGVAIVERAAAAS